MAAVFQDWVGRSEVRRDLLAPAPLAGLAALLDLPASPWTETAPPLAHWLYFLPTAPQSELGEDGHPKRGGFLPPIELPRRMWAGSRLTFHAPLRVGSKIERTSTIRSVTAKSGASGEMVFVTVAHEVRCDGKLAISEEQDIVYRDASSGPAMRPAPDQRAFANARTVTPDETMLFRYSALTFNAHRIHYDRGYAVNAEGYSGLVVQGPLIATLLLQNWFRLGLPAPARFTFRAQAPLFDGKKATLCAAPDGDLWCCDHEGAAVMNARVDL